MTTATESRALSGLRVLVTRSAHQAQKLCELIEAAGGVPLRFPTIEIAPPTNVAAFEQVIARLGDFDLVIFVSPNAVSRALPAIQAQHGELPRHLTVVCVGSGSAHMLGQFGIANALVPARSDSEGMLELAPLREIEGKRVLIIRGEGGRELLADTLRARGAQVEYAECYRRVRPQADSAPLTRDFMQGRIDVVTVTSADALRNLYEMIETLAQPRLNRTPLIVVSERLRDIAHELGHSGPVQLSLTASDAAIVAAIDAWRRAQKNL